MPHISEQIREELESGEATPEPEAADAGKPGDVGEGAGGGSDKGPDFGKTDETGEASPAPKEGEAPPAEPTDEGAEQAKEGETAKAEEKEAEPAKEEELHDIVVDGKVEERVSTGQLIKERQLASLSYKRIQEATQGQKDMNYVLGLMTDEQEEEATRQALWARKLGSPEKAEQMLDKLAFKRVKRALDEEDMSEKERAVVQRERELSRREKEQKASDETTQRETQARFDKIGKEKLEKDVLAAFEKVGVPNTPRNRQAAAREMLIALDAGFDMNAEAAAVLVKQQRDQDIFDEKKTLSADELAAKYPDQVKELRGRKKQKPEESTAFPSTGKADERGAPPRGPRRSRRKHVGSIHDFHRDIVENL